MSFVRVLMSRCASVFRWEQLDRELDDELRSHLEPCCWRGIRRGCASSPYAGRSVEGVRRWCARYWRRLVFSFFGSGLGLAMSWMTTRALRLEDPAKIPQLVDLTLDWRVLVFTLAAGLGTCLLFGLAPAVLSTRVDVARAMNSGGRSSSGSSRQWFRKMLVTAQIALSLMLLVGAGLLIQTMPRLQNQDLGFRVDHLMRAHFYLPPAQYSSPELITRFCDRYTEGLRQVPGIREVSVTTIYPPSERWPMMFSIEGKPVSRIEDVPSMQFGVVDANYLPTAGTPVMRGRNFSESDREQTLAVAIVNEAFVRRYLPDEDPIGRRV
jgi:hypothetical protein